MVHLMKKRFFYTKTNLYIILFICLLISDRLLVSVKNNAYGISNQITVAIDAGHGGFDPGKVGVYNILEKDINLIISKKLQKILEEDGISVIMTRTDEKGLYKEADHDKKRVDMQKRVSIINSSNATLAVSIHQNSYTSESIKGAQVFYYSVSSRGKELAEIIQNSLKNIINDGNKREAKPNSKYYMLINTSCPLVIVECGFLTNYKEAKLLTDDSYQNKVVYAIYLGIIEYLNKDSANLN
jgi:N-acetylmuramoyl-L-alanine amidase